MSLDFAHVKWGRVVIGAILGAAIAVGGYFLVSAVWGVVLGFQVRGMPPQDVMIAAIKSLPYQLLVALMVFMGGYIGGRQAGRGMEGGGLAAGLATGVLVAVLAGVWRVFSWSADVTLVAHVLLAIAGGTLGGWLAGRPSGEEMGYAA